MDYIFFFLIVVLVLVIFSIANEYKQNKILISRLKNDWGQCPEYEPSSEKMKSIMAFYLSQKMNTWMLMISHGMI